MIILSDNQRGFRDSHRTSVFSAVFSVIHPFSQLLNEMASRQNTFAIRLYLDYDKFNKMTYH